MKARKIAVILNGISRHKGWFSKRLLPRLANAFDVTVNETRRPGEATALAAQVIHDSAPSALIAAGGDGTLHQVINGVLSVSAGARPAVGLIPLGSGNDFAKTTGIRRDADQLLRIIQKFEPGETDVGIVRFATTSGERGERYFINVADAGMGPVVVNKVSQSSRFPGAGFAYYRSILSTFLTYRCPFVDITAGDTHITGPLRTIAIANGRYYGHGLCIAPDARLDDNRLDVFVCGNVSIVDFILQTGTLKKGRHVRIPGVSYHYGTRVTMQSDQVCFIEADGEVLGVLPAEVELHREKIRMLI